MKTLSKTINFPLNSTKNIDIKITKKRMKNIRLKITKSGIVSLSIPTFTTYAYAYQFLVRKREWIVSQLNAVNQNLSKTSCNFVDNGKLFLLGNYYTLNIQQYSKNKVVIEQFNQSDLNNPFTNCNFIIYTKDLNSDYVKQIFIKWCKNYFLKFFNLRLQYFYNQIFSDKKTPILKIKSMKSMWGNCNFVKRIITLNLYLCKVPIQCVDYVIMHELCHLTYHNHSKQFYDYVSKFMPDWKERKQLLKNYSLEF